MSYSRFRSLRHAIRLAAGVMILMLTVPAGSVPHNDQEDNSVEPVLLYHRTHEARPETLEYLSWSPVTLLENGRYKVTVVFRVLNRYGRSIRKKQIFIMDASGGIINVMNLR